MKMFRRGVAAMLVALLPTLASAQADGRVSGTVRDQSNALVAGATVTVKNEKTGEVRAALSNDQGFFVVSPLKPSTYTVSAAKPGFAIVEYTTMPLAVGQELALDFEFRPAGVQESVTVVATAPVLDISSARIGANVSEREVQNLPVNGRQMSQLMLQAPGSQNAGDGTWQDIRFSGRANEQNVIKYDGVEGSAIVDASPGNANGENKTPFKLQASLENVQEFRIESSGYAAELGTGTGGQVSVITKSGGNDVRGSLFEYVRSDRLDSRNYFDALRGSDGSVLSADPKSSLTQNQFGGSVGGPIVRNRAFFFGSYEGYRLDAGKNFVEAVPSAAAWSRAVPAIAALRPGFTAPGAVVIAGASTNPDLDIVQLQDTQRVSENAYSARLDYRIGDAWSAYARVFHDQGTNRDPAGVTGKQLDMTANPSNVVVNLQGLLGQTVNEFKVGYNAAPTTIGASTSAGFENINLSLSGTVANSGIAGQGSSTGLATPGGLVRVNSAGNGRGAPYDPYSLTFADTISRSTGNHLIKVGGDVRLIRMATDQLGGITYTFANLSGFLANAPTTIQYFGDLSEPSPFNNGAAGMKHTVQNYFVTFAQDEWRISPGLTLNYGLRYDYYSPLRERDNRIVKFNIESGTIDPNTTPFLVQQTNNFQPRVSATWMPASKTVIKAGGGIFVGPGQTEDQLQPVEAERISTTVTSGALLAFPVDANAIRSNFTNNPNNRSYQPRAYANDYTLPEKVYSETLSVQQELPGSLSATVAYVGSQGRNLFLRSIANRTVGVQSNGAAAGTQVREFDIVTCTNGTTGTGTLCPGSSIASIQRPYAEIDYKTSGGRDTYHAMQLSLTRRSANGLVLNGQYTLGYSKGNTGGSNEAITASNNARALDDFDFDYGFNNFDVRHTYNLSALYTLPGTGVLTGGWSVGGILNGRSGLPINVTIGRNDVVYVDAAGNAFLNAAADRTAVVNTPGGGASRATRRPDLVPGVDPFIQNGGLLFLNPAAFATPAPGTFGNLERNALHGPLFRQVDVVVSKRVPFGRASGELRMEIFNIFNTTNFANPPSTLANALPSNSTAEANKVQPGQPYTQAAAGSAFGRLASTVGTTVGLGTNRQVQVAFRLNF
ncbi:MAG TPA: TonB-dependent receptor [Vicinamibacterales bacterium]|nr:TonB-dependent receptor [Vicinamibacterales bacterium]